MNDDKSIGRIPQAGEPNAADSDEFVPFVFDPRNPLIKRLIALGVSEASLRELAAKDAAPAEDEIDTPPPAP